MPIPQFHRTPKLRKRRARRSGLAHDTEAELIAANEPLTGGPLAVDDDGAQIRSGDAEDSPPSEEVPALLSGWPPHRSK